MELDNPMDLVTLLSSQGHDVFKLLCSKLSPPDIFSLSNTCRSLQWIKHRRWNINAHLSRFFKEPLHFRSMMARYNAVVSGSNALQFFEGCCWPESDLDLYLPPDEDVVKEFMKFLVDKEGYELNPYSWQGGGNWVEVVQNAMAETLTHVLAALVLDHTELGLDEPIPDAPDKQKAEELYEMNHIKGVFCLGKGGSSSSSGSSKKGGKTVQIIVSKVLPVDCIIKGFYSTLVVNFYTWNKAYSIFPWLTFKRRLGVMLKPLGDKNSRCVLKYVRRGYSYTNVLDPEDDHPANGLQLHRRIGGHGTWTMDLDATGVDVSGFTPVPVSVLDYSTFSANFYAPYHYFAVPRTDDEREMPHWELECKTFVSPILEHKYLYDAKYKGHDNPEERWVCEFGARAQKYSLLACWMFEDEETRSIAKRGWMTYDYRFPLDTMPDCFEFRDRDVKDWYERWRNGKGIVHSRKKT